MTKRPRTPRAKYTRHRNGASERGIPFLLTFNEWYDIWIKSGQWHERGPRKGQYCMSRYGDIGAYAVGNVFIQLHSKNVSDYAGKPGSPGRKKQADTVAYNWEVTDPTGKVYVIRNLNEFGRTNSINAEGLASVARGSRPHYKKWTCKRLP